MASPFDLVANATATFQLPAPGLVEDDYGNDAPATTPYESRLFLKRSASFDGGDFQQLGLGSALPGVGVEQYQLSGYAVEPSILDERIRRGIRGTIEWGGVTANFVVSQRNATYGDSGFIAETLRAERGDDIVLTMLEQS